MTTSGTIGKTVIQTAVVLEHALRRCGKQASDQTPEIVDIARSCLYLLLTHYANKGLNLWCVERKLIGYVNGQKDYLLPVGTNDVLNVLHATPQTVNGTLAGNILTLSASSRVVRIGVKFSVLPTIDFQVTTSADGVTYNTVATGAVADLIDTAPIYWYEVDPAVQCSNIAIVGGTVSAIYAATSVMEITVPPLNRDTYAELPNKEMPGTVLTGFLFGKTLNPFLTVWPVPSDPVKHMALWVHRQIEDVGKLTNTLAIPQRWYEATIVQLAFRLSIELPGIDPARITLLSGLADKFQIEAGNEETDSAPIYLQPNISGYTR